MVVWLQGPNCKISIIGVFKAKGSGYSIGGWRSRGVGKTASRIAKDQDMVEESDAYSGTFVPSAIKYCRWVFRSSDGSIR